MADEQDRMILETSPRSIRWLRLYWWVVMIAAPIAMPSVILSAGGPVSVAVLACAAAGGVMLLNGYRTVIGVRLSPDRLRLITALSAREYRWEEVRTRHLMFELHIHVRGVLFPYTYASVWREGREAMATIRYYAGQARP
jgi:hypothetical protein